MWRWLVAVVAAVGLGCVAFVGVYIVTESIALQGVRLSQSTSTGRVRVPNTMAYRLRRTSAEALGSLPAFGLPVATIGAAVGMLLGLRQRSRGSQPFLGALLGGFIGFACSMTIWILFGGWGPPMLFPAAGAGLVSGFAGGRLRGVGA